MNNKNIIGMAVGFLPGILGGLLGVGGGIIMIPLMVKFLKLRQQKAHGNSLIAQVFIAAIGSAFYSLEGTINLMASLFIAPSALLFARFGANYAHVLPEMKLKRFLGFFFIFGTVIFILQPVLFRQSLEMVTVLKIGMFALIGAVTGFLSGMLGIGGAILMIPAMVILLGLDQHTAQGSSLLVMLPMGIMGSWTNWRLGNVETGVLPAIVPSLLIGTYLGTKLAHMLTDNTLRDIFVVLMFMIGIRYVFALSSSNRVKR